VGDVRGQQAKPAWAAGWLLCAAGCSVVTPSYEEITLDVALLPMGSDCTSCLKSVCPDAFSACSSDDGCVNYGSCRVQGGSPVAHFACDDRAGEAAVRAFDDVLNCRGCAARCGFGQQWGCIGRFAWPDPVDDQMHWEHRLLDSLTGEPYTGATVRACLPGSLRCEGDDMIVVATTDDEGRYSMDLPLSPYPNPERAGFNGFFRVTGGGVYPYRIQFTAPLSSDGSDTTSLFSDTAIETLGPALDITVEPGRAHLFFQVFDCRRVEAEGVEVIVTGVDDEARLLYGSNLLPTLTAVATSHDGGGTAAILNLDPSPQVYEVAFRVAGTGQVLSSTTAAVVADEATLLLVTPGSSAEMAAE
jgi:hypothetical protein